jgi:hypothetical protein
LTVSPAEVARAIRLGVAAEMADERAALDGLADGIARLLVPAADPRDDWMRALALAFQLERYYTATEVLVARVLRQIDGDVPTDPYSHLELLRAASVALDGGRPAVVSPEALGELRELLKFRHLARHGYEVEPDLVKLSELGGRVARSRPASTRWIAGSVAEALARGRGRPCGTKAWCSVERQRRSSRSS